MLPDLCRRGMINTYTGWIERRYSTNTFKTDRSADLTFTVTDPCGVVEFSPLQTFFTPNSDPYFALKDEAAINFNITGGYI